MPFRKSIPLLTAIAVFCILCQTIVFTDTSEAADGDLMITEVHPKEESFTLINLGTGEIDLRGYRITDGEGTLEVINSLVIAPGGALTVSASGTDPSFSSPCFSKKGNLQLADAGDELSVCRGGETIDCVCWGRSNGADGWLGEPAPCASGYHLLRIGSNDTGTAEDWIQTRPGWTNLGIPDGGFAAKVSPFSFPESRGEPILQALSSAEESIDICIYLLSSPEVVSVLCQKVMDGVSVRVLVEGSPLGTDISTEISLMKTLSDTGGEVRMINHPDSEGGRFLYVHSKYAVIDRLVTVVTSENWTRGNIGEGGNRGWGIIAESTELAEYMERVFGNDYSDGWGDVAGFPFLYPNARPYAELPSPEGCQNVLQWYEAEIAPIFSPDDSFQAMHALIAGAEERVYAEQMDLATALCGRTGDTPVAWMNEVANRGADTRLVLDTSQSDSSAHEQMVAEISSSTSLKAVGVNGGKGFALIHNKGVIADDAVWIGSVNWTSNSFLRNRESALIVRSAEVADVFADLFLQDFGVNYYTVEETGLEMCMSRVETSSGPMLVFSVNGPDGAEYEWELGNGTVRRGPLSQTLFRLPGPGTYTATVRIVGTDYVCSATYTVDGYENGYLGHMDGRLFAGALAILVSGIAATLIRRRGRIPARRMYR